MAVSPATIAVALGVAAPESGSITEQQWDMWITDAENQIAWRMEDLGVAGPLDAAKLDYVVREAVKAHAKHPDDATQVAVAIDDGNVSRTYRSSAGLVEITDKWWKLLGLIPATGRAYEMDTMPNPTVLR